MESVDGSSWLCEHRCVANDAEGSLTSCKRPNDVGMLDQVASARRVARRVPYLKWPCFVAPRWNGVGVLELDVKVIHGRKGV